MRGTYTSSDELRLICLVCRKQFSQYTCPRCNVRYCSLPCYKNHSPRCLESFSRDNVLANMQKCVATPETRRRMLQALQRFHDEDTMAARDEHEDVDGDHSEIDRVHEDDGEDNSSRRPSCILSEVTLNKLAAGIDIQFDDLSTEEKKAFLRSLKSGELSHMVKPWEPWWLHPSASKMSLSIDGTRVVQPLETVDMDESNLSDIPLPLDSPLPPLRNLTAKPPSPLLIVHLVEILYSYCFILRFYNGDWTSDTFHAAWTCLSVSHVLGSSASPETVTEALNECFITICSPNFKSAGGVNFAISLLDDVIALLHIGRPGVICALSDLHRMLEKAVADCKLGGPNAALKKRNQKSSLASGVFTNKTSGSSELKAVCKKVFFLLCWANEQPLEIFTAQALIVENEKARFLEIQNARTSDTNKINTKKHSIEELTEDTH